MAGPQLAPFHLQRSPLHSCKVDRIEKCPSTKSAACGLRNPYPVSVWCNSVTPCIRYCTWNIHEVLRIPIEKCVCFYVRGEIDALTTMRLPSGHIANVSIMPPVAI